MYDGHPTRVLPTSYGGSKSLVKPWIIGSLASLSQLGSINGASGLLQARRHGSKWLEVYCNAWIISKCILSLGRSTNPAKFAIISNGFVGKRLVKLIDSFFLEGSLINQWFPWFHGDLSVQSLNQAPVGRQPARESLHLMPTWWWTHIIKIADDSTESHCNLLVLYDCSCNNKPKKGHWSHPLPLQIFVEQGIEAGAKLPRLPRV